MSDLTTVKVRLNIRHIALAALALAASAAVTAVARGGALRMEVVWTPAAATPSPASCRRSAPPAGAAAKTPHLPQDPPDAREGC